MRWHATWVGWAALTLLLEAVGLKRYAVTEIRGGIRRRYEADTASEAWAAYAWAKAQRDAERPCAYVPPEEEGK